MSKNNKNSNSSSSNKNANNNNNSNPKSNADQIGENTAYQKQQLNQQDASNKKR